MEVLGSSGSQFREIIRRIGNPLPASEFSPNRMELIELIGIVGRARKLNITAIMAAAAATPQPISSRQLQRLIEEMVGEDLTEPSLIQRSSPAKSRAVCQRSS